MQIAQMAQAVESHPWRKPPAKLCFGGTVNFRACSGNALRERRIFKCFGVLGHVSRITTICWDV